MDDIKFEGTFGPKEITVTPSGETGAFATTYGTPSAAQEFTVAGTGLTAAITATAPEGFEVSSNGTTWGTTASFAPTAGTVSGATLRARLKATAAVAGSYNGVVIALTSPGATTVNLTTPATGNTVTAAALTIAANAVTKPFGQTLPVSNPGSTAFTATGLQNEETVGSVTITYTDGYEFGDVPAVYPAAVVPSAASGGTFAIGNYAVTYQAADLTVSADPEVTLTGTLTAMGTTYGTASAAQTLTVSGAALTANLVVTAPAGYEVSTAEVSGYGPTVTLTPTAGAVAATTLYVRLKADTAAGAVAAGVVSAASTGATTKTVAVPAGSVTEKELTIAGLAAEDKLYDRTTAATLTGTAMLSGVVAGDEAAVSLEGTAAGSFPQTGIGTGLTVTVTGLTLTGGKAGNYTLAPLTLTADIEAKPLALLNPAVVTRTFNGTTAATITGTLDGVIAPDVVTFTGTGTFDNAGPGAPIPVTATLTLGGGGAGNYVITQPTGLTGRINGTLAGGILAQWLFNGPAIPGGNSTPTPSTGTGTAALAGGASGGSASGAGSSDLAVTENNAWNLSNFPAQGTGDKTRGAQFSASTAGANGIAVLFDIRMSNTAPRHGQIQYTTDGTSWLDFGPVRELVTAGSVWVNDILLDFTGIPEVNNNPNFGVRVLAAFAPATSAYAAANTGSTYGTTGTWRLDDVRVTGNPPLQFTGSTPNHGAAGVSTAAAVELRFTKPVTMTAGAVTMVDGDSNPIAVTGLPVTTPTATVTLTPTSRLPYGKEITVTLARDEITAGAEVLQSTTATIPVTFSTEAAVAPVVAVTPAAADAPINSDVTLTATVTAGSAPVALQWYEGDAGNFGAATLLTGETSATLVVNRATVGAVSYFVRATSAANESVNSNNAVVNFTNFILLTGSSPANNATGVVPEAPITLTFSRGVKIAAGGVTITPAVPFTMEPGFGAGEFATVFTITPAAGLAFDTSYTVVVDDVAVTDAGSEVMQADASFSFRTVVPAAIVTPPASLLRGEGQDAVFTVAATGDGPLSYDWRRNGTSLGAPNSATLTLTNVNELSEGVYAVVVSGPGTGNEVESAGATLTVQTANDPVTLTGTSYTQDFDGIGGGLPLGWSVRTGAGPAALGEVATFNRTAVEWGAVGAGFRNSASATGSAATDSAVVQGGRANRAAGLRQTGGFGDPGAAFAFTFSTLGKTLTGLSVKLQMLSAQARSTTWSVQVGTGAAPASWETVAVHADPGVFGSTTVTVPAAALAGLENQGQAWFRVVALGFSAGGGNRDTFAVDDFELSYTDYLPGLFWDANGAVAGAGGATPAGSWGGDAYWSAGMLGDEVTGAWVAGERATFAAGSDATGAYTVTLAGAQTARTVAFEEGSVTLAGDALVLTGAGRMEVAAGATVVAGVVVDGTAGLLKTGAGGLSLTQANLFTGEVRISGGHVEIGSDAALGAAENDVVLNGELRLPGGVFTLPAERALRGGGTLVSPTGGTVTVAGPLAMQSGLRLSGDSAFALTAAGSTIGVLAMAGGAEVTGAALTVAGMDVETTGVESTLANDLGFSTPTPTVNVAGSSQLTLTGVVTLGGGGANRLIKTGEGTLVLPNANAGLNKLAVGGQGLVPVAGGVVKFGHPEALGLTQVFFNFGRLEATAPMTGTSGLAQGFSIGGREGTEAVLGGEDMEVTGTSDLFAAAGTFGDIVIKVENRTVFTGTVNAADGAGVSIDGLTIKGTGVLGLAGVQNTFREGIRVTETATLELDTEELGDANAANAPISVGANAKLVVGTTGGTRKVTAYHSLVVSGRVEFDLGGATPGSGYDQIELMNGTGLASATMDGLAVVKVNLAPGFTPAAGTAFQLVKLPAGATRSLTVANLDLPVLTGGLSWDTSAWATDGVVAVRGAGAAAPVILSQPTGGTYQAGDTVVLAVGMLGGNTGLTFVWRKNGAPIPGAPNGSTLTLTSVTSGTSGTYSVVVSNATGSVTSGDAVVLVEGPPVVTVPPQSRAVDDGVEVEFGVTVAGIGPFTYQWQFNESDLAGETNATLKVTAGAATRGSYRVIVGNAFGQATSAPAGLFPRTAGPANTRPAWEHTGPLPDGQIGAPYAFKPLTLADDPAANPPVYRTAASFSAAGLPAGLTINASTGEITGRPVAIKPTPFVVTVTAKNSFGSAALRTTLLVRPLATGIAGVYTGPVARSGLLANVAPGTNGGLGGRIDFTVSATGLVSGKVVVGVVTHSFRAQGIVNPARPTQLEVNAVVKRKNLTDLVAGFKVEGLSGTVVDATVSDGAATAAFEAWRNPWSRTNQGTSLAGLYNVSLNLEDAALTSAQAPVGGGYLSFTVNPTSGKLTATGRLSDGSAVVMTTHAGPAGQILIYRTLYAAAARGSILGALGIAVQAVNADNTVEGALTWSRPTNAAAGNRLYRGGFPSVLAVEATGARYVAPTARTAKNPAAEPRVMGLTDAANEIEVLLGGAGVEAAEPQQANTRATVGLTNKVVFSTDPLVNTRKMSLVFNAAKGSFTGKATLVEGNPLLAPLVVPVTRVVTFQGLIVAGEGTGYFILNQLPTAAGETPSNTAQQGGRVEVRPVAPVAP